MQHPFLHRLRLERKLIRAVNSRLSPNSPQLNGTSCAAIDSWLKDMECNLSSNLQLWKTLCQLLKHTGNRLRLHSDASHRGFAEGRLLDDDETSTLIQEVEVLASKITV